MFYMQMACWRRYNSELSYSKNEKEDACDGKESGILSFPWPKSVEPLLPKGTEQQFYENTKCYQYM